MARGRERPRGGRRLIPRAHVTAWRARAPWPSDAQVEQDLVLSRALVELYARAELTTAVAFRGGTALHKLLFPKPGRYSEDIDFVQVRPGPIGPVLGAVRAALNPWLGDASCRHSADGVTLVYRFQTTALPVQSMRLKVEINTREHGSRRDLQRVEFEVANPWFEARAEVLTYSAEELLATKLRALYQRKKGRDLFDLGAALADLRVDHASVVAIFREYLDRRGRRISRAEFERNLARKEAMPEFLGDVLPLLAEGAQYDPAAALALVRNRLVELLPGQPWRRRERRGS